VDPAQWLANYDDSLTRAATDAQMASASLQRVGGCATSPRGEVTATVGASGALEDLNLTPAARTLEADHLAQLILATTRQAQRAVGAQVVEIMTEYLGEGPALELVKKNIPAVETGRPAIGNSDDDYFANPPEITQ
jgi:hypothetical protein